MKDILAHARLILEQEGCTCVLTDGHYTYTSQLRGIRPLLELLDSGKNLRGFCAADKVVGRAAAMVYCLMGIPLLHADVISQGALQVLQDHGIQTSYTRLVAGIRNRTDTGPCPMEQATVGISDPAQALIAIRNKLKQLNGTP